MKITKLVRPEPQYLWSTRWHRCENQTTSSGTGYFPGNKRQCARYAAYRVGDVRLCRQHAGDAALKHLLEK